MKLICECLGCRQSVSGNCGLPSANSMQCGLTAFLTKFWNLCFRWAPAPVCYTNFSNASLTYTGWGLTWRQWLTSNCARKVILTRRTTCGFCSSLITSVITNACVAFKAAGCQLVEYQSAFLKVGFSFPKWQSGLSSFNLAWYNGHIGNSIAPILYIHTLAMSKPRTGFKNDARNSSLQWWNNTWIASASFW